VGCLVGLLVVGLSVGDMVGTSVGASVGFTLGAFEGSIVGVFEGDSVQLIPRSAHMPSIDSDCSFSNSVSASCCEHSRYRSSNSDMVGVWVGIIVGITQLTDVVPSHFAVYGALHPV